MALESAAVLADELSRTDAAHLKNALNLCTRVVAAQTQSRWLARVVFIQSRALAFLRDRLMRLVSMEQILGPLTKELREPI